MVDAKLARTAKARAVAQTAFYSHLLAALQGVSPRWMHLALGAGELASFKVGDYAAYERQARRALGGVHRRRPGRQPAHRSLPRAGRALRDLPVERPVHGPAARATTTCRWSPGSPRTSGGR